ncbi:MAG: hypothetical protein JXQ87_11415 [Bacteroidia bacterium]
MDAIHQIISTFSVDDQKEFTRFVRRTSPKGQSLVLELFSELKKTLNPSKEVIMNLIYKRTNYDAYKALRKRLLALLQRFVSLRLIDSDSSNTTQVISTINLARYLYGHQKSELAFKFLKKAEQQALSNDLFEILNSIYTLQIEYSTESEILDEIIKKWEENKKRLYTSEKIEIAIQLISKSLNSELIETRIEKLELDNELMQEPRFAYQLAKLYRTQLLQQKDFLGLKTVLEKQFQIIQELEYDKRKGNYYYVSLLYMMAHIAYRNKYFKLSHNRTIELGKEIDSLPATRKKEFEVKYFLLLGANQLYMGKPAEAISTFKVAKDQMAFKSNEKAEINRKVNLSMALALNGSYREAKLLLLQIERSNLWLTRQFGEEWLLKKSIIEALLHYELDDFSLLDSKLRFIKTKFRSLLKRPIYQRALVFVKFIEKLDILSSKELEQMVDSAFEFQPVEQEDLQAMTFYAWLKSKWVSEKPYAVLMKLLNITPSQT